MRLPIVQVVPAREVRAGSLQDDDLDRAAASGIVEARVELVRHALVLRVPGLGPIERHDRDAAVSGIADLVADRLQVPQVDGHTLPFTSQLIIVIAGRSGQIILRN